VSSAFTIAGDHSVDELRRELAEARRQQVATAGILAALSNTPTYAHRVFAQISEQAAQLCESHDAGILRREGDHQRFVGHHGPIPVLGPVGQATFRLLRGYSLARAVIERQTLHIADMQAETVEYPEGSAIARQLGHRTMLVVPLIRAGEAVGVIYVRRTEVRPFTDRQIHLLKVFADQAVTAIDHASLLQADFAHAARISMLGELTASIAHEVNQPLAAIAAGGEAGLRWLARPTPNIAEVQELTKRMVADARRASEIIARIRDMASRRVPEQALLSLDDVISETLAFLRREVESRGVAVSHYPGAGTHKIVGDRTQLQQVIVNLTVNAVQAMAQAKSERRDIIIRTVAQGSTDLRCSIEDSGPGVPAEHSRRLFDSFFTTKDGGMGMGLRICRSIIEAHGGGIEVDNRSAMGGARFSFALPVARAPA
jgi:C4-dicarboxylate-specific signal transduction histidine kinase